MNKDEKDFEGADAAVVATARSAEAASPATARHTEGPWGIKRDWFGSYTVRDYIVAEHGYTVAGVVNSNGYAQNEANAHLIAAAPTMRDYIAKKAAEGDAEAMAILEATHGRG